MTAAAEADRRSVEVLLPLDLFSTVMRRVQFNIGLYIIVGGVILTWNAFHPGSGATDLDAVTLRSLGVATLAVGLALVIVGALRKPSPKARSVLYEHAFLRSLFAVAGVYATLAGTAATSDDPQLALSLIGLTALPLAAIPYLYFAHLSQARVGFWTFFVASCAAFFGLAVHNLRAFPHAPLTNMPAVFVVVAALLLASLGGLAGSLSSLLVGAYCRELLEIEPQPAAPQ